MVCWQMENRDKRVSACGRRARCAENKINMVMRRHFDVIILPYLIRHKVVNAQQTEPCAEQVISSGTAQDFLIWMCGKNKGVTQAVHS